MRPVSRLLCILLSLLLLLSLTACTQSVPKPNWSADGTGMALTEYQLPNRSIADICANESIILLGSVGKKGKTEMVQDASGAVISKYACYTYFTISVSDLLKGDAQFAKKITLIRNGGDTDAYHILPTDGPEFQSGDRFLFFTSYSGKNPAGKDVYAFYGFPIVDGKIAINRATASPLFQENGPDVQWVDADAFVEVVRAILAKNS